MITASTRYEDNETVLVTGCVWYVSQGKFGDKINVNEDKKRRVTCAYTKRKLRRTEHFHETN